MMRSAFLSCRARENARQADCGSTLAPVYGGFGTTLALYGFDVSIQFSYQLGGRLYDGTYQSLMHTGTSSTAGTNWHTDILDAWSPENPGSDIPRLNAGDDSYQLDSDRFLVSSQGAHNDFGYPSICMAQDSNGPDMVCSNSGYNWFSVSYDCSDRQYNYIVCYLRYSFFYNQIKLCNDVLAPFAGMDYSAQAAESRHAIGQALAVRAFDYLGLAPYYQFRYADSKDLPCVPIVSETMTQEEYTDNPRASVETVSPSHR